MGAAENKATVEGAYAAFGQGDIPGVIGVNAPDAVWVIHSMTPALSGEYKGPDAIGSFFQTIGDNIEISEFSMNVVAADGDLVVAVGDETYTQKATGDKVSGPLIHLWTFGADGKVTRFEEWESN